MATAFVDPDVAGQGGDKFLATAMIFHAGGIGFGVGEHLAGGIDDGGASAGRERFLRGDVLDRMLTVDFDAVGEQADSRGEATLDLVAQRAFPDSPDSNVHGDGGHDHNQRRGGQHLEEDPVSHFGASKR